MMIKNADIWHSTTEKPNDKKHDDLIKSTLKIQKYFRSYTKNLKEEIIKEVYDNKNHPNIITQIHKIHSHNIEKNNINKPNQNTNNSNYFASYTIVPNSKEEIYKNLSINNIKIDKIFYHSNEYLFTIANGSNKTIINNDTQTISFLDKHNEEFNYSDFSRYQKRKELFADLTSFQDCFPVFIKNRLMYITINRGDNAFDYVYYNGCISFLLLDYNKNNDVDNKLLELLLNAKHYDIRDIKPNCNIFTLSIKEKIFQGRDQTIVKIIDQNNNHIYFWFIKINNDKMFGYKAPDIAILNQYSRFTKLLQKLQTKEIEYINQDTLKEFFQIKVPIVIKKFLNLKDWLPVIKDVDKLAAKGYALTDMKLENMVVTLLKSNENHITLVDVGDIVPLGKLSYNDLQNMTYTRNYMNSNISNYIVQTAQYSKYIAYYNLIISMWQSLADFNIYKVATYILNSNCMSMKQKTSLSKQYKVLILENIQHIFHYGNQQKNIDLIFIKTEHNELGTTYTTYDMYYYKQTSDIKIMKYNIPLFQKLNINKKLEEINILNTIVIINDSFADYLYEHKFYNNYVRTDNEMKDAISLWTNKYIKPQYYEAFKILLSKPYELEKSNINLFDIFL